MISLLPSRPIAMTQLKAVKVRFKYLRLIDDYPIDVAELKSGKKHKYDSIMTKVTPNDHS